MVKTLLKFATVKLCTGLPIQAITLSKRRNILLVSNGSEFLFLVAEDSLAVSINVYRSNCGMQKN